MHRKRAQKLLKEGDVRGASKELSLADSSLITFEAEQPLEKALAGMVSARKDLSAGHPQKADKSLQKTELQLMSISSFLSSPLHGANKSAWLAFGNISTARKAATAAHLANTRKYLEQAGTKGNRGGEEIRQLSQQVALLEKKLADEGKLEESELKAVWEESKALEERGTAYLSTKISEEETTLKGEDYLIEARLHLAYAETDQLTTLEPDKADQELSTTYGLLEKAGGSPQVGPSDRKIIHQISRLIIKIQKSPEKHSEAIRAQYDEARQDLNGLLNRI